MTDECNHSDPCRHERELRKQSEVAVREALRIQTEELSRRLDILNGHQQELAADRARYVLKESYQIWHDSVNKYIDQQSGRNTGISIAWAIAWLLVGLGLAIAGLFFKA